MVKRPPTMWETQVRSLGWEDPLEKEMATHSSEKKKRERHSVRSLGWEDPLEQEMATHSSILAWKIPWTENLDGLQFMGPQTV